MLSRPGGSQLVGLQFLRLLVPFLARLAPADFAGWDYSTGCYGALDQESQGEQRTALEKEMENGEKCSNPTSPRGGMH